MNMFGDKDATSEALAHLRRESLDLYNRVHSVAEDCEFVKTVREAYPLLPVVPNLRCGAWYVDPVIASSEAAYFKSTDGHFNNWSFNLRRPNIHLLPFTVEHGGFILVDSTRSGKRMPDALAKTVPIWCAVINRAVRLRHAKDDRWDTALYTSPAVVSPQEHAQIEAHLDGWAKALNNSSYNLPDLAYPLRPLWITPATSSYPRLPPAADQTFYPIICVSASKQIDEGLERRSKGFSYVQGSGDDHELWGEGLTPDIFWAHSARILGSERAALPALVRELVAQHAAAAAGGAAAHSQRTGGLTPVSRVRGRLVIGRAADLPVPPPHRLAGSDADTAYIVISEAAPAATSIAQSAPGENAAEAAATTVTVPAPRARDDAVSVLALRLPQGKRGQKLFLDSVLPQAVPFADAHLAQGRNVCVCCDSGRDASVGVVLTALQLLFDDHGEYVVPDQRASAGAAVSKASIGTRLQWIITSRPQANPSRATLKRVNEFLMTPPALRGK